MSICHTTSLSMIPAVCKSTHPSVTLSVHDTAHLSVIPSVCQSTHPSVALVVHDMVSLSVIPVHLSYDQSVCHPVNSSLTHQSVTPPASPAICPPDHLSPSDHLYTILPRPSNCPSSSDHSSAIFTSLSDCLSLPTHLYDTSQSLSACLSPSDSLTATMTHPTAGPSSNMIQRTQDSSQSLAVMNGSNPASPRNSVGPLLTTTYFYMP